MSRAHCNMRSTLNDVSIFSHIVLTSIQYTVVRGFVKSKFFLGGIVTYQISIITYFT